VYSSHLYSLLGKAWAPSIPTGRYGEGWLVFGIPNHRYRSRRLIPFRKHKLLGFEGFSVERAWLAVSAFLSKGSYAMLTLFDSDFFYADAVDPSPAADPRSLRGYRRGTILSIRWWNWGGWAAASLMQGRPNEDRRGPAAWPPKCGGNCLVPLKGVSTPMTHAHRHVRGYVRCGTTGCRRI